MAKLFNETGSFTPDSLIVSNEFPILKEGIALAAGQGILKRGSLIGKISEKGYLTGTEVETEKAGVIGILTDDIDTGTDNTGSNVVGTLYITGCFNEAALIKAEGATIDKTELKKLGIFLKSVQVYE